MNISSIKSLLNKFLAVSFKSPENFLAEHSFGEKREVLLGNSQTTNI